jgi:cell wall assembly regulator SMI1
MANPKTVFVFPFPPELERDLPASLAGALAYYHDRPLLGVIEGILGPEPEIDRAVRSAIFDRLETLVDDMKLAERLYSDEGVGPSKKQVDIRGFVHGTTLAEATEKLVRAGFSVLSPGAGPAKGKSPAKAASGDAKRPSKKPLKAIAVSTSLRKRISKIRDLALEAGVELAAGASTEAIVALEAAIGVKLPEEVRAFYSLHDGGPSASPSFGDRYLLSVEGIEHYHRAWQDVIDDEDPEELDEEVRADRGVRKNWWNPGWIPVTHDAGGNHEMIDSVPTKAGKVGQIVSVYHDDGERSSIAPDLLSWLEQQFAAAAAPKNVEPAKTPRAGAKRATKPAPAPKKAPIRRR